MYNETSKVRSKNLYHLDILCSYIRVVRIMSGVCVRTRDMCFCDGFFFFSALSQCGFLFFRHPRLENHLPFRHN